MSIRRFGDVLLGLGLLVGIGAVVGYELDIVPTLPPEVLKIVIYKLTFVGGLGLLVAGAFVRRLASHKTETSLSAERAVPRTVDQTALPEGEQRPSTIPSKVDRSVERLRREP
jgi:hypothetical protein